MLNVPTLQLPIGNWNTGTRPQTLLPSIGLVTCEVFVASISSKISYGFIHGGLVATKFAEVH
jgi:hypothetical protein